MIPEAKTLMTPLWYVRVLHSSDSGFRFQPSPVGVRDKPAAFSGLQTTQQHANNDAFLHRYLHAGSRTSKHKHQKQSNPCTVCLYLPLSVTIRHTGVYVVSIIGPLCCGSCLIFTLYMRYKDQIHRDAFLERTK